MKKWKYRILSAVCVLSVLGNVFLCIKLKAAQQEAEIRQEYIDKSYESHLASIEDLLFEISSHEQNRQQYLAALMVHCQMANGEQPYSSYKGDWMSHAQTALSSYFRELAENDAMWQDALKNETFSQLDNAVYEARQSLLEGQEAQEEAFLELEKLVNSLSGNK